MSKTVERLVAEKLRQKGWSIGQIARKLSVSKSSASHWCENVLLTPKQQKLLRDRAIAGGLKGRLMGAQANKDKKLARIESYLKKGKERIQSLSGRELLLVGIAIYWGEGSKKSQLAFINSDKDMILLMYKWFQVSFGVRKEDFIPRVFVNALHKSRDIVIKKYWSKLLELPVHQFRSTIFIKRPNIKKYSNHETYFGLLSLRLRNSTELKYRILGLIEGLKYSKF